MTTRLVWTAILCAAVLAAGGDAIGQSPIERNPDFTMKPPAPDALQKAMAVWMQLAQPSIYHERLKYFVGEWDAAMRMWTPGVDAPPQEARAAATYRWLMDGRWLAEEISGDMMGMEYRGFGITGYDNFRHLYTGIWIDNMSTVMATMTGTLDASGKVLTLHGSMDEPTTGEIGKTIAYIYRIVDDRTHVFEYHDLSLGAGRSKVLEITYTRKE
jgi:hypothetical protein